MLKKISILSLLLCLLFSLVACKDDNKKQELEEKAYKLADINEFFKKKEDAHLNVLYEHKITYLDEEDTIYNMLVSINYEETSVLNLENKSLIDLHYEDRDRLLHFYPEQCIVASFYIVNFIFSGAEAERYYKVDETDFNTLYEKLEYCVANPNVEEKE